MASYVPSKPDPKGVKVDCMCDRKSYVYNGLVACREPLKYEEMSGKICATLYCLAEKYLDENRQVSTSDSITDVPCHPANRKRGLNFTTSH